MLVLPAGLEPATYALGERCSIQSELRELDSARISDPVKVVTGAGFSFTHRNSSTCVKRELSVI